MLVVEPFILLQYKPTKVVGKPLRISDGEAGLANDSSAGLPPLPHLMSALNCCQEGHSHNLNQAVQNLRRVKIYPIGKNMDLIVRESRLTIIKRTQERLNKYVT